MADLSSPDLSLSFDPALYLHSEPGTSQTRPTESSHSDEIEALNQQQREQVLAKTEKGIVIQHRAWKASEAFRSDDIHNLGMTYVTTLLWPRILVCTKFLLETPSKTSKSPPRYLTIPSDTSIPSSPPANAMALISSPVTYPPSSSPPVPRKKRKLFETLHAPSSKKQKLKGGFVDEDEAEEGESEAIRDAQLTANSILEGYRTASNGTNGIETESFPPADDDRGMRSPSLPPMPTERPFTQRRREIVPIRTCSGKVCHVSHQTHQAPASYQSMIAQRSTTAPGKAKRSYYGVDIHKLLDEAAAELEVDQAVAETRAKEVLPLVEAFPNPSKINKKGHSLWTEKYRARKFTDLIGDERTHRSVLRWLKGWDPVVFPGLAASRPQKRAFGDAGEERTPRKIMLLTGPPGLGKTTLAHVCARQAGYEVLEINASDERSRDVVKGRIKDALGTENVKGVNVGTGVNKTRKAGRPVCVVVDEVDGVVSGSSSGGEGGFMKALIDLVQLDQKNSSKSAESNGGNSRKPKKGDNFRLLRPLILICNDVYHPSLRPLRASTVAEIIHVRKPPLDKVVSRVKEVFEKEGIPCDSDGARKLCEATWGLGGRKEGRANSRGSGEGDIRGILVACEWMAQKLRSSALLSKELRVTRKWVEENVLFSSLSGETVSRGLGRGGVREIVERVFLDGAGFPNLPTISSSEPKCLGHQPKTEFGVADIRKRYAITQLREMVDTSGDYDRCITDCFTTYPTQTFQDDIFLSKPNAAYDWLHFHDQLSSRVFSSQEWELNPYLPQSVLAFHNLFAAIGKHAWDSERNMFEKDNAQEDAHPFSGPKADFAAYEAEKQNQATINAFRDSFSAPLARQFGSADSIATELLPSLGHMLAPDIKPVVVGGSGDQRGVASVRKESEKLLVKSAVKVMSGLGITFERTRVEMDGGSHGGWVYRMEP